MSTDPTPKPTVTAKTILSALAEIKRRGRWPLFQQLEQLEPDLSEHVLEELSLIHQTLIASGASPKVTRRLQRQVHCLVLVVVLATKSSVRTSDSPANPGDQT